MAWSTNCYRLTSCFAGRSADAGGLKVDAKNIDSTQEGPAFVERFKSDRLSRLRFYRGTWINHAHGAYRSFIVWHQAGEINPDLEPILGRS